MKAFYFGFFGVFALTYLAYLTWLTGYRAGYDEGAGTAWANARKAFLAPRLDRDELPSPVPATAQTAETEPFSQSR